MQYGLKLGVPQSIQQHQRFSTNQNEAVKALYHEICCQDDGFSMILSEQSKWTKVENFLLDLIPGNFCRGFGNVLC